MDKILKFTPIIEFHIILVSQITILLTFLNTDFPNTLNFFIPTIGQRDRKIITNMKPFPIS